MGVSDKNGIPPNDKLAKMTGWWYTYPSEKYEFVNWNDYSQYMEKHVPNHQPDDEGVDGGWNGFSPRFSPTPYLMVPRRFLPPKAACQQILLAW